MEKDDVQFVDMAYVKVNNTKVLKGTKNEVPRKDKNGEVYHAGVDTLKLPTGDLVKILVTVRQGARKDELKVGISAMVPKAATSGT